LTRYAARQAELWDRWAEYQPHLYPDRDPAPAVRFLHGLAGDKGALELGAGTGRVALPLARQGVAVAALEISEALIRRLQDNDIESSIKVIHGDMAEYCDGQYSLIYAVHSTFFHLTRQELQVQCMSNVAKMLTPDGVFVLSCFVPNAALLAQPNNLALTGVGEDVVDIRATVVDASTQTILYRELHITTEGIRILPAEQRFCWPSELDLMARLGGMNLSDRFADFTRRPYRHDCVSQVSIYRLAPSQEV
jgi:SAM-dependent methyltransferase